MKRLVAIALFAAALFAIAPGCEYERMYHTPYVRPYEQKMPDTVPGTVPVAFTPERTLVDVGEARFEMASDAELMAMKIASSPASIARGKTAYGYFCVQCHGYKYNGDGTVGQSFHPLPTDLMDPYVQEAMSPADLWRSISYGAVWDETVGAYRHPPLAYTVSPDDRWHIINFIGSLGVRKAGDTTSSGNYDELKDAGGRFFKD